METVKEGDFRLQHSGLRVYRGLEGVFEFRVEALRVQGLGFGRVF